MPAFQVSNEIYKKIPAIKYIIRRINTNGDTLAAHKSNSELQRCRKVMNNQQRNRFVDLLPQQTLFTVYFMQLQTTNTMINASNEQNISTPSYHSVEHTQLRCTCEHRQTNTVSSFE